MADTTESETKVSKEVEATPAANAPGADKSADGAQIAPENMFPYSRTYQRAMVRSILQAPGGEMALVGQTVRVGGWVKTGRVQGNGTFAFLEVSDGSCATNLQVLVKVEVFDKDNERLGLPAFKTICHTGTSVLIEGVLEATPEGVTQPVELHATRIVHVGQVDPDAYPIAKGKLTLDYIRDYLHLRPRTYTIEAVARVRSALAFATHKFFQEQGFHYVHTPIVTASDCEGAGEMFQVSTLLTQAEDPEAATAAVTPEQLEAFRQTVSEQGSAVKAAKTAAAADKSNAELKAAVKTEVDKLLELKSQLGEKEKAARVLGGIPRTEAGKIDYENDFFGQPAFLTVSGQLNAEYYACALSNVYTFGPTFRAEKSQTRRHLAEFWMIEPEMVFCDLVDDMKCAEDYTRYCCQYLLDNCRADMEFFAKRIDKDCISRLEHVAATPFTRVSYTEAIEKLEEAVASGAKTFEFEVKWGVDLQTEHERYLAEELYKQPVIVYDYPAEIKAFYMKLNPDGKTVAAMDVLVPRVGELIGGSQREDDLQLLEKRIVASGMEVDSYKAYLDIRRFGNVPHSGFGLGFERLIMFATGIENIREVIPFPRWHLKCDY